MATKFLVEGATDLSESASWSPAGVPEAADTVVFRDGSQHVNAGLDALAALTFADVIVESTWNGILGTTGAGMQFTTVTGCVKVYGGRDVHLAPSGTVPDVDIQKRSIGTVRFLTGTYTMVRQWIGNSEFQDATTITKIGMDSGNCVIIGRSNSVGTLIVGAGAVCDCTKNIGTLARVMGTLTTRRTPVSGATVATMDVYPGGRANHKSGGAITLRNGFGGVFSDEGGLDYTITNEERYASFRIVRGVGVTVTNTNPPVPVGPDEQSWIL